MSAPRPTARRYLPSIASLRALEALDRLGSATAVAEELSQTQSAVSRQLQALETQLGTTLIIRDRKQMKLTPAAADYAASVREALDIIAKSSLKVQVNPDSGSLNLAILPTFGMRWLVPRLAEFAKLHPEITINMSTRIKPFSFSDEPFDAALHFGSGDLPGCEALLLKPEHIVPVCAPSLLADEVSRIPAICCPYPCYTLKRAPTLGRSGSPAMGSRKRVLRARSMISFRPSRRRLFMGLGSRCYRIIWSLRIWHRVGWCMPMGRRHGRWGPIIWSGRWNDPAIRRCAPFVSGWQRRQRMRMLCRVEIRP